MKRLALVIVGAAVVAVGAATADSELNNPLPRHYPTKDRFVHEFARAGSGGNLSYHGGPTITQAKVLPIFWGSAWANPSKAEYKIAMSLQSFLAAYGTTGEYNVITQYSGIQKSTLYSSGAIYDTTDPGSAAVTDAMLQAEVTKYFPTTDNSTIYEVFLPNGFYSTDQGADSCGGSNLQYCAYHSSYTNAAGQNAKYGSMPYPSCGGCSSFSSDTQNFEHFISHETREAVTDPDGNAWFDRRGNEADDKCAWSPAPFTDASTGTNQDGTPFAYQYEWSNANSGCVKTR
jgi:hypothetical protein